LYQSVVAALRRRTLTAPARHFKEGVFLANGGAVWFEAERPAAGGGLIEGSTPESRGPREAVRYQRAQDRLLAESARAADIDGDLLLVKNDRDAYDHVYGAQENYEAILATGWSLFGWRVGVVLLSPLVLLTWLSFLVMIACLVLYLALAGLIYLPLQLLVPDSRRLAFVLFGRDLVEGRETGCPTPVWLESTMLWATRVVTAPLALALLMLAKATAFRRVRSGLLPFLISRSLLCGSGTVDQWGEFHLADKAPAINCVLGFGGFLKDRPLFTLGHFFKAICIESCLSPRDFIDLFSARQRLQIGLGDSNMCESAEYLRVGTTALLLDVIDAGELPPLPRVRRPIRALHDICADPTLTHEITLVGGQRMTALELQRFYYDACCRFLQRRPEAGREAREILALWGETLHALSELPATGGLPQSLIGTIDWVTKKHLLNEAGRDAPWSVQKKIDIRFHELSEDGYFQLLDDAGLVAQQIEPDQVKLAMRNPPSDSPATMRGHYIREFSSDDAQLSVSWKQITMGRGVGAKVIRLAKYNRHRRLGVSTRQHSRDAHDRTASSD
jgi:proteasome accessory factor A